MKSTFDELFNVMLKTNESVVIWDMKSELQKLYTPSKQVSTEVKS